MHLLAQAAMVRAPGQPELISIHIPYESRNEDNAIGGKAVPEAEDFTNRHVRVIVTSRVSLPRIMTQSSEKQ